MRHRFDRTVRRAVTLFAAAWALLGATAAAQEQPERVVLTAENQWSSGDLWRGEGDVRVLYQDIDIRSDHLEYDRSSGDVVARGNVVVDRGPSRFTADELRYNLITRTGVFTNATAFIDPMYSISGRVIEKLDETRYRIERGTFTTCDTDGRPPWSFSVRSALVEEEGLGRFKSVALEVQDVPVLFLPYMVWPVKQERAAGFLMPRLGYSNQRGFNFGLPFYLPIGRSYDTTIFADYYTAGYVGLGNSWRWAPVTGAAGEIDLYGLWDREADETQWKMFGTHVQDDFLGFRLLAQVENLSDIDFWQDFDRSFDATTRRDLYSFAHLTRSFGAYALNVRADYRETFLTGTDVVLSQLPEIEVRSGSTAIAGTPIYLNLISSLSYLRVDRGGELASSYGRADLFPTFSYTLPTPPWLSVTPRIGGRATYYTQRYSPDRRSFLDDPIDRLYAAGGVDVIGPSFSRVFEGGLGAYDKIKHLIEPRIQYVYLTTATDVSQVPIFDEVDSTPQDANLVRMVLANRILGRGGEGVGTRELGSLEISQDYSFDAPLNPGDGARTSQLSALGLALRVTPTARTGFDARLSWDHLFNNLRSTSLAASAQGSLGLMNLTWYQNFSPSSGDRLSSQIRTLLAYRRAGFPLEASVQVAYDIARSELGDQRYGVSYQGSCWNVSATYRDTRIGAFPNREFLIVIGLKGVGALPEIKGSFGAY